jgi:hypothetical protein
MTTAAATDLAGIGSALSEAHVAAAAPTVALVPAAADEVSAGVAHLFSRYAEDYHALAGKAAASQEQFVQNLKASAVSYTSIEAAITSWLQSLNASVDQLIHTITALPADALSAFAVLWLRVLWGVSPTNPDLMEFVSQLLAPLPPLLAIPLLLTAPVSVPLLYLGFALSMVPASSDSAIEHADSGRVCVKSRVGEGDWGR